MKTEVDAHITPLIQKVGAPSIRESKADGELQEAKDLLDPRRSGLEQEIVRYIQLVRSLRPP